MKDLLTSIVAGLVQDPSAIQIVEKEKDAEGLIVFELSVAAADMGRIIGKEGKIAKSIRTIMRAAAARIGEKVTVEIKDIA
jgi:predicted RNA-binding protein YlqC (UPF0109 family)